ncbi:hypothetical protein [Microlunatus sp. Y2014]|uniref:hypothetical protein n=1 Tax=Microlunatus sp. Y2014 TaxID=3418488 RepID=UPI003DA6D838
MTTQTSPTSPPGRDGGTASAAGSPGVRIGSLICAIGGAGWWIAGSGPREGAFFPLALLGLACGATLVWFVLRHLPDDGELDQFRAGVKRYNLVNLAQIGGIVVAIVVGVLTGRPELIPGLIAVVNGAHFVGLARTMRQPAYARLGLVVVGIGLAGLFIGILTSRVDTTLSLVGFCVAIAYWFVPAAALLRQLAKTRPVTNQFHLTEDDEVDSEWDDEGEGDEGDEGGWDDDVDESDRP